MDTLAEAFAGSFQVTHAPNTTAAQHPRYSQYKAKGNHLQNNRRQKLLEIQKQNRFDALAHSRRLADGCWKGMGKEVEAVEEETEDMEVQVSVRKPGRYYKNQLMMSEWLVEVPEDFEEEWLMVLCPVAKRSLVVASHGNTVVYNKVGYRTNSFPSFLPGGNHHQPGKYNDYTIMDCLYQEATGTYWILDLMCWKSMPIYETETEFRFYWLHQNLQENPNLGVKRRQNPYCFQALPCFPCTPQAIEEALANSTFEIDGLIFFHKRTHYTFGSTPLVVWLKPYMVQDVLNIPVPPRYMRQMPESYTGYAHHIEQVKADKYGHQHRRPKNNKQTTPDKKKDGSNKSTPNKEEHGESNEDKVGEQEVEMGNEVGPGDSGAQVNKMGQSGHTSLVDEMGQGDSGTVSAGSGSRSAGSRSRATDSNMDTCASDESISQNQAQIKLLIQPTKFNFGKVKMSDKINPSGIHSTDPSEQFGGDLVIQADNQLSIEANIATILSEVDQKDEVVISTDGSMWEEPSESVTVSTESEGTSPDEKKDKTRRKSGRKSKSKK